MKKHDEGYALPFVLVVMTVLILIAMGVMGYAQRNLEAQKNSIVRMQEKYAAAAQIEQIYAVAENPGAAVGFPQTDTLFFNIEGRALRIASAKTADSDVWVITEVTPVKETGMITDYFDDKDDILIVKGSVKITKYRIVEKSTAEQFVNFEDDLS